jgi:hypothetical protein
MNDYEDTILQELMYTPVDIFDIPDLNDSKFDVEDYINNSNLDY